LASEAVLSTREIKLWDARTGQERATLSASGSGPPLAFSPDGRTLAGASGAAGEPGEVKLWDARTGQERAALNGHTGPVSALVFRLDGKPLASGSADKTIKLWDAHTGEERATLQAGAPVIYLVFSPDSRTLANVNRAEIKLWDGWSGQERATLTGHTG